MIKKSIVKGALILTAASLITRILGFVYRIYMSNIIGAEGMGLYQLVMPIYFLCWSIAASGFSTTVSKLVAQENAKKEYGNMGKVLKLSILITSCIGLVISLTLFNFATFIATDLVKDSRIYLSLRIISFCFPFMAASSCIRGYFFGLQETAIPAVAQVLEQIVRMSVIFILAGLFIPMGLEYACAVAAIGIVSEEIFSFLFVVASYYLFKKKNKLVKKPVLTTSQTLSAIMIMAIPLTFNRVTGSLLTTVEDVLIPQKLMEFGVGGKEALSIFGQLTGMAMPLIQFPSAFLVSLSIALVPEISSAKALNNEDKIGNTISKSILFSLIIGIGAAAIFLAFPNEIGRGVYNQMGIGSILIKLALLCPFMYLLTVFSGILNGLGEQMFIFRNSLISSVINISFIFFLIPRYGIDAFIAGWFISLIVSTVLCILKINKIARIKIDLTNWIFKPIVCISASALVVRFVAYSFVFSHFRSMLYCLIIIIGATLLLYFALLRVTGCITDKDIKLLKRS